jgi:hypothetical protein
MAQLRCRERGSQPTYCSVNLEDTPERAGCGVESRRRRREGFPRHADCSSVCETCTERKIELNTSQSISLELSILTVTQQKSRRYRGPDPLDLGAPPYRSIHNIGECTRRGGRCQPQIRPRDGALCRKAGAGAPFRAWCCVDRLFCQAQSTQMGENPTHDWKALLHGGRTCMQGDDLGRMKSEAFENFSIFLPFTSTKDSGRECQEKPSQLVFFGPRRYSRNHPRSASHSRTAHR